MKSAGPEVASTSHARRFFERGFTIINAV